VSKNLGWRFGIVVIVIALSLIYLTPSLTQQLPDWWIQFLPQEKIKLGLDLQGGIDLSLEVKVEKAVENNLQRTLQELTRNLRKDKIRFRELSLLGHSGLKVVLMREDDVSKFENIISSYHPEFKEPERIIHDQDIGFRLPLKPAARQEIMKSAVTQAVEKIRTRIDTKGLMEPDIRVKGDYDILIQIPGVKEKDYKSIIDIIKATAVLEFKMVDDAFDVQEALRGNMPPGREILYDIRTKQPYLLKKRTLLTGEDINNARVQFGQRNEPQVGLTFNSNGARIFREVTRENVGKNLAIILDNKVYSAPRINEEIPSGQAQITGQFTMDEAKDLVNILKSGSLAAPVEILYQNKVGPSLGRDSIEKGFTSMIIGGLVVIVFMAIYYGLSGLIADLALLLNILFIMAGLSLLGATLTLPGIAGIILTIGMAVDANVLIFERIREEIRLGKPPRAAIDGGYRKALVTIIDANVTTFIVALILIQFGTGPIKGFAYTLGLGIVASMITAVFFTRIIFDYLYLHQRRARISI